MEESVSKQSCQYKNDEFKQEDTGIGCRVTHRDGIKRWFLDILFTELGGRSCVRTYYGVLLWLGVCDNPHTITFFIGQALFRLCF